MLSLERVRQLIPDPNLTDEQLLEIRDQFYTLCEIIYEKWRAEKDQERLSRQKCLHDVSHSVEKAVGNSLTIPTAKFCSSTVPDANYQTNNGAGKL